MIQLVMRHFVWRVQWGLPTAHFLTFSKQASARVRNERTHFVASDSYRIQPNKKPHL